MGTRKKPKQREAIGAAEFKARCLELFDRVHENGAEYVVTKHGRPVARVVPTAAPRSTLQGAFAGRMRIVGDIVHVDWQTDWEAAR